MSAMAQSSGVRARLLGEIAGQVPESCGDDCVRVAVDGVDGSGKTTFANELSCVLMSLGRTTIRISADDFHHVREVRHRLGRDSPEGFWLDSYNYEALAAKVLDPLGRGGSRRYRAAHHDVQSDALLSVPWQQAPPGAVLIFDGLFLHRDELVGRWDLSIFLEVSFAVTAARMAERDGSVPDPDHPSMARYVGGQRLYFEHCEPWKRASLVVNNEVLGEPHMRSRPE